MAGPVGDLNRLERRASSGEEPFSDDVKSLPVAGAPGDVGIVFNFYARPEKKQKRRYGVAGHSFISVVDFGQVGFRLVVFRALLPLRVLLEGLPSTELDAAAEARLRNGQPLKISGLEEGLCALYRSDGGVIGLGEARPEGVLKPLRLTSGLTQAAEKHRKTL